MTPVRPASRTSFATGIAVIAGHVAPACISSEKTVTISAVISRAASALTSAMCTRCVMLTLLLIVHVDLTHEPDGVFDAAATMRMRVRRPVVDQLAHQGR